MIYIEPKEPGPEWKEWKDKAAEETQKLIDDAAAGKPIKLKKKVWQDLKDFLKEQFKEKCCYCEGKYGAGSSLDVEHFRPKGKVTDYRNDDKQVMIKDEDGNEIDHPGYYWLAYCWRNLLLSCEKCNRGGAKADQFPISGIRASSPGDPLEEENPLLLNPYEDKDEEIKKNINFGAEGIVEGKTERGRQTVSICNLNRAELQTARREEFEKRIMTFLTQLSVGGKEKIITNEMQFSTYLRVALKRYLTEELPKELAKRV